MRAIQGVSYEASSDEFTSGASKLRRMAFWIGAGALLVGIYVGTKGSGKELSQFWRKNASTVVAQPFVPIGAKDVQLEQINNLCKARGEAAGGGNNIRQAAGYVACLSAESPKRFCQALHRAHFLSATTNYYRLIAKNREVRPDPKVVEALKAVVLGGFVPRRDVVAAGDASLETAMQGVEPKRSGC